MSKKDDEKRMMIVGIINWVEDESCDGEERDDDGGGDSATHTLNQTRDNNTDFKSYHNYTVTITVCYNSITHQYCFSCSSNNQTTINLCKHSISHCHYFFC